MGRMIFDVAMAVVMCLVLGTLALSVFNGSFAAGWSRGMQRAEREGGE